MYCVVEFLFHQVGGNKGFSGHQRYYKSHTRLILPAILGDKNTSGPTFL